MAGRGFDPLGVEREPGAIGMDCSELVGELQLRLELVGQGETFE